MARRNLDLWAIVAVAGAGLALQWLAVVPGLRAAGGLALAVVCPGLALTAALFPGRLLAWPERVLFSLGLSLAAAILGAVLLNGTIWGLTTGVWAALFAGVTLAASLVAAWRRGAQPAQAEADPGARWPGPGLGWRPALLLGLAAILSVTALTLARTPPPAIDVLGYTLLWATPAGDASAPGINVGISSSELTTTHYRLTVTFDSRRFLDMPDITLDPGGKWERLIAVPAGQPGGLAEAVLYRLDAPTVVYRRVTLLRQAPGS